MKCFFAACLFGAVCFAQTPGEATLSGRVTDAITHQPISGANVTCGGTRTTTDINGVYSFTLIPGTPLAFIAISKKGYPLLPLLLEKTPARITAGASLTRDFELTPSAVISGHLLDLDSGKPIAGFAVTAKTQGENSSSWTGPRSGPDGAFAFTDLKPGDFIIEVNPPLGTRITSEPAESGLPDFSYGRSWFPGVPREEMASPVTMRAGETRMIEVRLQKRQLYHVAGLIQLPGGSENDAAGLSVTAGKWPVRTIVQGQLSKAGPFRIDGLSEGTYIMSVSTKTTFASRKIELTNRDIDDMRIVMRPFIAVRTAVTMAEDKVPVPADVSLSLKPFLPSTAAPIFKHLEDIPPGEYWPGPTIPNGYAVVSVSFNGRPVVNTTIDLEELNSTVSLVLTSRPAGIAGTVRDANQNLVPHASVALLPESLPDILEQFNELALHVVTSDANGAFRFTDLGPGRYKAVALTDINRQRARDLVFLRDQIGPTEPIVLDFGQNASVDLHVK